MNYILYHDIDDNPETNEHLDEIIQSIRKNGWVGLPLLAIGDKLLNGSHRATACKILGIDPQVHQAQIKCTWGEDDYIDYLLESLADAVDTLAILQALKGLQDEGLVDDESVMIMQAEYNKE